MNKHIILALLILVFTVSCEDRFLDLDPLDQVTESVYFTEPEHFEAAANQLYVGMVALRSTNGSSVFDLMDFGSDLHALDPNGIGSGSNIISNEDKYWANPYKYLRNANIILDKAESYPGDASEIAQSVGTAYFFRAWQHFFLLQRFGGVPIVTNVVDLNSEELYGERNSRYEVIAQILADLDLAIDLLPTEVSMGSTNLGKIGSFSAKAFKSKVLLYEATWERYVGTDTDGDGINSGAGTTKPEGYLTVEEMLSDCITLSNDVMVNGGYQLWSYNNELDSLSSYYLFNLEDEESNPASLTKASNNEFIIQSIYDFDLYQGNVNISHTVVERLAPNRKMMDLFLCMDGLPVDQSPLFQGYNKTSDEFIDRDFRMTAYFGEGIPEDGSVLLPGAGSLTAGMGVFGRKYRSYNYGSYRGANEESFNWSHLRLAEVYLNYAEALFELNGSISDSELNASINLIKERAGLPALTNAFAAANGLDILNEIRRERAVELFAENSRFNDLKRWGLAEELLGEAVMGAVIEGTEYESNGLYDPVLYPNGLQSIETAVGMRETIVLNPEGNRNFTIKNYLYPIPTEQIQINNSLVQNPGW